MFCFLNHHARNHRRCESEILCDRRRRRTPYLILISFLNSSCHRVARHFLGPLSFFCVPPLSRIFLLTTKPECHPPIVLSCPNKLTELLTGFSQHGLRPLFSLAHHSVTLDSAFRFKPTKVESIGTCGMLKGTL